MTDQETTVTATIDGKIVIVPKGTTVYTAAKQAGIEIPIFCYHDRMPPLGACRMCLVRAEKFPKLQTSCTLEAADGMVVYTATPEVKAGQEAILEFLLINHPLDCPICDKGGECPLQDQTFKYGPGRSRFVEAKRDFAKPVSLGQILVLDRERCILCWRCVRFGEIIAGDDALKGFERGFHSEINTPFTLPVQSKFIGNTIAICPVGALTAKSYRFTARPWDNRAVPSICTHCGVGCAVEFDVRGDVITRTRAREHPAVNDIWLCDLGFFGHAFVHHGDRLRQPMVRRDGSLVEATWEEALDIVARRLRTTHGERVGMLGGARLTNEDAYVAGRFFRTVVGTNNLDHRVDARPGSPSLAIPWGMTASIAEVANSDAIVLVGSDITEEYPIIWVRMKQAIDRGATVIAVTPKALEIGRFISQHLVHRYGEGAAVVKALADAIRDGRATGDVGGVAGEAVKMAAEVMQGASRPIALVGKGALEAPDGWAIYTLVQEIAREIRAQVCVMRGKGNSFGAALAGLLPDAGPGGRPLDTTGGDLERLWGIPMANGAGMTAPEIIEAAAQGQLDVLYVIGADPANDVPDRSQWIAARAHLPFLVVQDAFLTETAQAADVVLPTLVAAEKDGTVSNIEGRVQRIHAAVPGPGDARSDWVIIGDLAARLGKVLSYSGWQEIFNEMRTLIPGLALDARVPISGSGVRGSRSGVQPRSELQDSVRVDHDYPLVLFSGEVLFDRGSMTSRCPAIADLAGEPWAMVHPADAARAGIADGDAVVLRSRRGTLAVRAKVSDDIVAGQVYFPRGYDSAPVNALVDQKAHTTRVRIHMLTPFDQAPFDQAQGGQGGPVIGASTETEGSADQR